MRAIKVHFDRKTIKVPKELRKAPPGDVVVLIPEAPDESADWLKAQEPGFAKAWDNDEEAVYDEISAG